MKTGRGVRELRETNEVFRALAHPSRRHVLVVLDARGGRMTAGEIARRFACSWPTTSRHLKQLLGAGLVRVEKQGREWIYVIERQRLRQVVGRWLDWFGPDERSNPDRPAPRGGGEDS